MLSVTTTFAAALGPLLVVIIVKLNAAPGFAAFGPTFVVVISALGVIVVVTEELVGVPSLLVLLPSLFEGSGSGVVELLRAVLLRLRTFAGATKLMVRDTVPTGKDAIVGKVTTPVTGS
jgi:hypothetical protein